MQLNLRGDKASTYCSRPKTRMRLTIQEGLSTGTTHYAERQLDNYLTEDLPEIPPISPLYHHNIVPRDSSGALNLDHPLYRAA